MGIKKLRQRKAQQQRAHWYNQPMILTAIAIFYFLLLFLLIFFDEAAFKNIPFPVILLLFSPMIAFILAAGFFWLRRLFDRQRPIEL
jgi:hypothetical protein